MMPGAYPKVEHLKGASFEYNLALLTKLERLAKVKHLSLLQTLINDGNKKLDNIGPRTL
jgi:hypothetical protein